MLSELISDFYPSELPYSYRVAPSTDAIDAEILKETHSIETISMQFEDFKLAVSSAIESLDQSSNQIELLRRGIPPELQPHFDRNPAPVSRLLASWDYVNQAKFSEKPNISQFLRGDRANWGLIAAKEQIERDIEEEIYDDILDYATSNSSRPKAVIVIGPAGYGVTTLLMSLGAKLVMERVGPVYMLKPGHKLLEGDIEFASSIATDTPVFILNNAADFSHTILNSIHTLADHNTRAMFLMGERKNEWRTRQGKLRVREYEIEPLSDPEIYRIIDCLERHGELNQLQGLSRALMFNAIKQKHGKELLVALREATEGRSFEAILESEYRGIGNGFAEKLYLIVCCFHMYGAYARDGLIETLMQMPIVDIYKSIETALAGVVIFDCLNEYKGIFGARTRHRTIASIVWERCGREIGADSIIQLALDSLNLNYAADAEAFDNFVRQERLVDSISTLDGKIRYFETACKKDPNSPYVKQHYSRMLIRSKQYTLALSQIEEAIKMNPNIRVLYHTKGMALMYLAHNIDSNDIALRRLVQSEECFRAAIKMYQRDEYAYQGLARLYIGWASKNNGKDEFYHYLSKAEDIINEGLKCVRERHGLWVESANIQGLLGNSPNRINDLEKAVEATPTSTVARYLLARQHRLQGNPQRALEVLDPIIHERLDEFRCFVEYAWAMLATGKAYQDVIAVLRLSNLYGYSDPRYLATLGGLLFLDGKFSEADEIFQKYKLRDFTSEEINSIQFKPVDISDPSILLRKEGRVAQCRAGYSFIDIPGYPKIICPGSKYGGVFMTVGLHLSVLIVFSAKGAIAISPEVIDSI